MMTKPANATHWLLQRAEAERADRIILPFEKRVLSSLLGMTPENLSRAFAVLKTHGVTSRGAVITLADRATLAAFARPDPLIDGPE
ncbi:helix-turn-helix domain-containing protein [Xanthobacter autotrophicus]|uniref:helix-turn-helix domain-containing protein n=1 Tax=Xanthobacter autotrophicus TaxID=280 RepID=UPI002B4C21D3|nr:helix-turn-helix domain-containing protein [Xanthobacter autotrophicus]